MGVVEPRRGLPLFRFDAQAPAQLALSSAAPIRPIWACPRTSLSATGKFRRTFAPATPAQQPLSTQTGTHNTPPRGAARSTAGSAAGWPCSLAIGHGLGHGHGSRLARRPGDCEKNQTFTTASQQLLQRPTNPSHPPVRITTADGNNRVTAKAQARTQRAEH